mgnify:CR=1 FL=1
MKNSLLVFALIALFTFIGCSGEDNADEATTLTIHNKDAVDVATYIRNLSSPNMKTRAMSAAILGGVGARAAAAVPALEKLAAGPEGPDQKAAADAIEKIRNAPAESDNE